VTRRFRDGHGETWWAAEAKLRGYGPNRATRLVVATTDPATLPRLTTWYLSTNLPLAGVPHASHPGALRATVRAFPPADLAEVVRLYGLRIWVEQGYRQVKGELGWADFQVRADRAIRRHWALVCCAFACCWRAWFAARAAAWPPPPPETDLPPERPPDSTAPVLVASTNAMPAPAEARGEKRRVAAGTPAGPATAPATARAAASAMADLAGGLAPRPQLARSLERHLADLARLVQGGATTRAAVAPRPRRRRLQSAPLPPLLTNYR
jgi:hypothetical protein